MKREFKERFDILLRIKETPNAKIGRGQDFEKLINDIFEDEGLLLQRSYHTSDNKAEQIDGAIELLNRIVLFEVKWVESGLAASDLYAFIGKIDNKLIGTLGLFISREPLSENFVNSLTKGRRRNVLLFHGNDVELLFSGDLSLRDYLSYCIRRYSFDNIIHYDARSFVKSQKKLLEFTKHENDIRREETNDIRNILKILFSDDRAEEYVVDLELQELNSDKKGHLAYYLLEKYPKYFDAYIATLLSKKNRYQYSNLRYALSELLKQRDVINTISDQYYELYTNSLNEQYLEEFLWRPFRNAYESQKDKLKFQKALYENFKKILGDYNKENLLTKVIKDIWSTIDIQLQKQFLHEYIEIFFSGRKDKYDQKQFSQELITNKQYKCELREWIESQIKDEIASTNLESNDIANEIKYSARRYNELRYSLDMDEDAWQAYIAELYTKHMK